MFTTIIFCLYRRLHAPLFRSPWLWMQWSVGPECSWSTVRHFWNKVVCPRGKFICNAESIFMYSSNQHLVLLFIRVMSCVWHFIGLAALSNSSYYMDNIQLTNRVPAESENKQGYFMWKSILPFVSIQPFYLQVSLKNRSVLIVCIKTYLSCRTRRK